MYIKYYIYMICIHVFLQTLVWITWDLFICDCVPTHWYIQLMARFFLFSSRERWPPKPNSKTLQRTPVQNQNYRPSPSPNFTVFLPCLRKKTCVSSFSLIQGNILRVSQRLCPTSSPSASPSPRCWPDRTWMHPPTAWPCPFLRSRDAWQHFLVLSFQESFHVFTLACHLKRNHSKKDEGASC